MIVWDSPAFVGDVACIVEVPVVGTAKPPYNTMYHYRITMSATLDRTEKLPRFFSLLTFSTKPRPRSHCFHCSWSYRDHLRWFIALRFPKSLCPVTDRRCPEIKQGFEQGTFEAKQRGIRWSECAHSTDIHDRKLYTYVICVCRQNQTDFDGTIDRRIKP